MFSNQVPGETVMKVMNTDTVTAAYDGRGQQSNRSVLKKNLLPEIQLQN